MRRAWTVLIAVALLVAPAGVVLAQPGEDPQGPPEERGDNQPDDAPENRSGQEDESDDDDEEDRRGESERFRERHRRSHFQEDNGSYVGDYVAFTLDENESQIQDYRLVKANQSVFASITLPASNDSEAEAHGAQFQYETDDGEVHILDVPPAVLTVEGDDDENATASITLADGVTATLIANERLDDEDEEDEAEEDESEEADEEEEPDANETDGDDEAEGNETDEPETNESDTDDEDEEDEAEENEAEEAEDEDDDRKLYRLDLPRNRTAYLAGEDLTYDNGTFTVADKAHFRLSTPFRGAPGEDGRGPPEDLERGAHAMDHRAHEKLEQAKLRGNVSVEVQVDANESTPVELGHVQVRDAWKRSDNPNVRAGLRIAADDDAPGTTVTIDLNESALENLTVTEAAQKLAVTFDNETIEPADDLEDVLNWRNDDGQAEYLLLVGGENVQVLVSVPHFSVHTVEVQEQSSADSTNGAPGVGVIGALIATGLGAALLATRKED